MSLADKLAATRALATKRIPPDRQAIMHRATDDLRKSGILERIVKVGTKVPDFALANYDGHQISSNDIWARGPMVLSFFRGSW